MMRVKNNRYLSGFLLTLLSGQILSCPESKAGDWARNSASQSSRSNVSLDDGWLIVRPDQTPGRGQLTTTQAANGLKVLEYKVQRDGPEILARLMPMAGFKTLSFQLWSQEKTLVAVAVEDRDKARFNAVVPLEASRWTNVSLNAGNFKLSDDSPVRKQALDARMAGSTFAIVELGKALGLQKANVLRLTNMSVDFGQAQNAVLDVPALIDGTTVNITRNGIINHPVIIRGGGKLVIKASTVHLASSMLLEHGNLEVEGGTLAVDGQFPHQYGFTALNQSTLSFKNCEIAASSMTELTLANQSRVDLQHVVFPACGFTGNLTKNSSAYLLDATKPGEFILEKGSRIVANQCHGILFWLGLGARRNLTLTLPPSGNKISRYVLPRESQLDLTLTDSDNVIWALVTEPGSELTVKDSDLLGMALIFNAPTTAKVANLKSNQLNRNLPVFLADRKMTLKNSLVKTWNLYAMNEAQLEINNCTFGELNIFGSSRIQADNSTCDGTGGYVRISNNSLAQMKNCVLNCQVVASNEGRLNLDNCLLTGDTTAADKAKITLHATKLTGQRKELGQGRIVVK